MSPDPQEAIEAEFEAEGEQTDELAIYRDEERLALEQWEPAQTGLERACYDIQTAARCLAGMRLATEARKPLMYYDIPNGGVGLNVTTARALCAARGNFEVVDRKRERGEINIPTVDQAGLPVDNWVSAASYTARVRDGLTNNITLGEAEEAWHEQRKGGKWFARPNAMKIARAIAIRNARLEHFAAVGDGLLQRAVYEFNAGGEYFSGAGPEGAEASASYRGQAMAAQSAAAEGTIGQNEAAVTARAIGEIEAGAGMPRGALMDEFNTFRHHKWPGVNMADLPTSARPEVAEWVDGKREALGSNGTPVAVADEPPGMTEDEKANATIDELMEAGKLPCEIGEELKRMEDPAAKIEAAREATRGADSNGG